MRANDLRAALLYLDRNKVWLFSTATLRMFFHDEKERSFYRALDLHTLGEAPLIGNFCRGLWYNPSAKSIPAEPLLAAVQAIRPLEFNYLSLETVLSEAGIISQMPMITTVMSTGPSVERLKTPFGDIEFVRTTRANIRAEPDIQMSPRGIPVASVALAWRDLKRVGRNIDLVDTSELEQYVRIEQ